MKREILLAIYLIMLFFTGFSAISAERNNGPREEDLIIRSYDDAEAAYWALKLGDIDILGYDLPKSLYDDAVNDPNILLAPVGDRAMYWFYLNNNYTIQWYPGIRSPTSYLGFRQALAFLTDKDYIVDTTRSGFADRIDQPIAYMQKGWRNTSFWYEDGTYPYEYNPEVAADILDATGFLQGSTVNPYYDSEFPGASPHIRTYPSGHSKAGEDLDELKVIAPCGMGSCCELLVNNMRKHGLPVSYFEWCILMDCPYPENLNYHIYIGGWSLTHHPPVYLEAFYHSSNWDYDSSNSATGCDENGDPNYPALDMLLEAAYYPNNYESAVAAVKNALGYITEQCITIPLFSSRNYWAYSKNLLGVVNMAGYGPENDYTFMNAYKTDGSPIVYGLKTTPIKLNILYSSWYYDYQCLDRIYLHNRIERPPYDLSLTQGGFLTDWKRETWIDPDDGVEKIKITRTIDADSWFVAPLTGTQLENVNTTHLYASAWFYKAAQPIAWIYNNMKDIKHINISNDPNHQTMEIYFDNYYFWNTFEGTTYILSFNLLSKGNLTRHVVESRTADPTTGYCNVTQPVYWINSVSSEGTPLVRGKDYEIYSSPHHDTDIRVINTTYYGASIDLDYLAVGDPAGFFIGDLEWQDALEGCGTYYVSGLNLDSHIEIHLKRNPYYWMETPPIGEIDFYRKPEGYHRIDIYDVVIAASAYGSSGISVPDTNWHSGVDVAPPSGIVDIFDIVTITGKYGTEWDHP